MPAVVSKAKSALADLRTRVPVVDHVLRMNTHYGKVRGSALAGAVTYFGFLSFFPLIALAFSVVGYISGAYPDAREQLTDTINSTFPGLINTSGKANSGQIDLTSVVDNKTSVGLVGLVGLLFAGLGWLDALREALRQVWGLTTGGGNVVVKKVVDIVVLATMGSLVLLSTAASGLATQLSDKVLHWFGQDGNAAATVGLTVLGLLIALLGDVLVLLFVFTRLPGHRLPWRNVVHGAILGAVVIELLKLFGTYLIGRTTHNAVYGTIAIVVGLLVWINLICRAVLYAAAWAVTGPKPTLEAQTVADADVLDHEEAAAVAGKALPRAHVARLRVHARRRAAQQRVVAEQRARERADARGRGYALLGVFALVASRLLRPGGPRR